MLETIRHEQRADRAAFRGGRRFQWLALLCYLLAAVALTWRLWADLAAMAPTNGATVLPDIYVNVWGMRYAAIAVAHGRLPSLITTAVNAPQGINLMWNTTMLLPSVLLAPVTLLAGPQASLAVLTTLGFAGSAASLFFVLRRWGAGPSAAALGGAICGFSPALRIAAEDHYPLQFAVLLPLIVDSVLRLATGRGRPIRTGAWLGVLISAQVFISEEVLVDTVLAGLLMLATLAASRPFVLLELMSLGGHAITIGGWRISGDMLPWRWLLRMPVVNQALPNRLPILADGAAAALLAFAADRTVAAVRREKGWRRPAIATSAAAALALAILPIFPRAVPASAVTPVPQGWRAVMAQLHLKADAPVIVLPVDGPQTMDWQAVTGEPFSVVSGYCIAPEPNGQASVCGTKSTMTPAERFTALALGRLARGVPGTRAPPAALMAEAILNWRPAAVITAAGSNSVVGRYLIKFLGPPSARQDSLLGWRLGRSQGRLA